MPAGAFEHDALVEPSLARAVPELCAGAREDYTSKSRAGAARHDMPIQIQDGPIPHRDAEITTL
jgi:hypothetical protein